MTNQKYLIILHTPGYTDDYPKRFFGGFKSKVQYVGPAISIPDWSQNKSAMMSFAEAKEAVKDLLSYYKEQEPDFECSFGTYEILSMECIASTSW